MEEAQSVCDRVAIIDRGKIVSLDTPSGLIAKHRNDPEVKRVANRYLTKGRVVLSVVPLGKKQDASKADRSLTVTDEGVRR